ncbi:primosomal protein N' [Corynebacterium epidermidicanis]|uniref:Probable replication restart protein PriA n=1 Tax=Corynebacterium epidermidicanis TaxID=1050174 RepID=A0A0G3GPV4_9CORY|nr:primosomal protein N' [Corynebacterium epidermidicanis]AKK03226.1 replication restart DNA helicase PriA [Corynebacterium epidermidicanis]
MPKTREPADVLPVARVLPLLGLAHLDREFDYLVTKDQDADAQPGVRVRIRFAGRLVDALLLSRHADSDHDGKLSWIDRVISPEVVYPEHTARLVEALCARYAGTRSDLIRTAIPARHASAESSDFTTDWPELGKASEPDLSDWALYEHGQSFVDAVLEGKIARAAWQFVPGRSHIRAVAALAAKTAMQGDGVLIVVPDQRAVDDVEKALREWVSAKQVTVLGAGIGPQARYRRFLAIVHGQARIVVGTRSAAFAPVQNLKLMVLLEDQDESLSDPRAPYAHAREVLTTRSVIEGAALVLGGYTRSAEVQLLVETGWAHDLVAPRDTVRRLSPRIRGVGDTDFELARDPMAKQARIPRLAFEAARASLDRGQPVLFQTPRKGYVPTLACGNCRTPARCRQCNGPLGLPQGEGASPGVVTCRWCGRPELNFRCGECGSPKLRAIVIGAQRTAEELGRAFSGVRIYTSGGSRVLDEVPAEPAVIVATPGAEPVVAGHAYGAAVLLDSWALLGRADLRASEETLTKWAHAAALVSPQAQGGEVIVVADPGLATVQSLIRWDMVGAARTELYQRKEVAFPPTVHMAVVDGPLRTVDDFLVSLRLPPGAEVLGPVDLPPGVSLPGEIDEARFGPVQRYLIRVPLGPRNELGLALRKGLIARSAGKDQVPLRVQVDPIHIG